jgi:hypothetical protein
MTGSGTEGRIMPALPAWMKKLNGIDDEARWLKGQRSPRLKPESHRYLRLQDNSPAQLTASISSSRQLHFKRTQAAVLSPTGKPLPPIKY